MSLYTFRLMASNLIFSYSGWFFFLPVPAFVFCDLGGVAGTVASEERSKKIIQYLSLLYTLDNQVSHFFPERVCISSSLPFITDTYRSFSCSPWCPWPGLITPGFQISFLLGKSLCIFPGCLYLLPISVASFLRYVFPGAVCSPMQPYFCAQLLFDRMHHSWVPRKWSLNITSFLGPMFPPGLYPMIHYQTEEPKFCSPEICRVAVCSPHCHKDLKHHHFMVTKSFLSFTFPTSLSMLLKARPGIPPLLFGFSITQRHFHHSIPKTSWSVYALLCCPFKRYQCAWSPLWGPRLVNKRLLWSDYRGRHPYGLAGQMALHNNVACPCPHFNPDS